MKNRSNWIFLLLLATGLQFSAGAAAQSQQAPKLMAVINRASWCPVCKANGPRVMKEVIPAFSAQEVQFISNDLSNKASIRKSTQVLEQNGLVSAVEPIQATGLIILIDNKTKKRIRSISLAEPTEKILREIKEAELAE